VFPYSNISNSYSCKSCRYHSWDTSLLDKKAAPLQSPMSDRLSVIQLTSPQIRFQRMSQCHAIVERSPALPQPHPGSWDWSMLSGSLSILPPGQKCILFSATHTLSCWLALLQSVCTKTGCHCSPGLKHRPEITAGLLLSPHSRMPYCCSVLSVAETPGLWYVIVLWLYCILWLFNWQARMTAQPV
jgi:hypothetical protein